MNICGWFEIPVTDIGRATRFYEQCFSVNLEKTEMGPWKMAMFPGDSKKAGAAGALVQGESYVPSLSGTMVYFSVSNIDETLRNIESQGGKTLKVKSSIGQYGYIAFFQDTEGNRVALHSGTA